MLTKEQLKVTMSEEEKINELNAAIEHSLSALKYLYNNLDTIYDNAMQNSVKKVYTTLGYEWGIACPDLIDHRVIGNNKRGRIIKNPPENKDYSEIGYDDKKNPLYFRCVSEELEEKYFNFSLFFDFDSFHWAAKTADCEGIMPLKMMRYRFDEKGRILHFTHIDGHAEKYMRMCSVDIHKYEYPNNPTAPIICREYGYATDYIPGKGAVVLPQLPKEWQSLQRDAYYEISPDRKKIRVFYKNDESGEYEYFRETTRQGCPRTRD